MNQIKRAERVSSEQLELKVLLFSFAFLVLASVVVQSVCSAGCVFGWRAQPPAACLMLGFIARFNLSSGSGSSLRELSSPGANRDILKPRARTKLDNSELGSERAKVTCLMIAQHAAAAAAVAVADEQMEGRRRRATEKRTRFRCREVSAESEKRLPQTVSNDLRLAVAVESEPPSAHRARSTRAQGDDFLVAKINSLIRARAF